MIDLCGGGRCGAGIGQRCRRPAAVLLLARCEISIGGGIACLSGGFPIVTGVQIRTARRLAPFDLDKGRFNGRSIRIGCFGHPACQSGKAHGFQKGDQFWSILRLQMETAQIIDDRCIGPQRHQLARQPCLIGKFNKVFASLVLLDLGCPLEQCVEVPIGIQQLRRRLGAYAGNTRDIVGRITGERLQVDHFLRCNAPFLDNVRHADLPILHRIIHADVIGDQLHQILVGRNDGRVGTQFFRLARKGRDQIIGFKTLHLDAGYIESLRCLPDQPELRDQIFGRRGAVCLVFGIEFLAEGL